MSHIAMNWAKKQKLPTMPKMVLMFLADHHNSETNACFPGIELLAEECGMVERSVIRQIEALEKLKLISVIRKRHIGNQYELLITDTQSVNKNTKVTESHPISDTQSFSKVTESHPNQEMLNKEINLSSLSLSENANLPKIDFSTDSNFEPISQPESELTNAQKIIMSVVKVQNREMPEQELKILMWAVSGCERNDMHWSNLLSKYPDRFEKYLNGSLGSQYQESEAKKTRASYSTTGTGNSFNEQNVGGHYASNSNIVQFRSKSNSIADRLAQQLAYCEWEEQQQRDSHEQQLVN